MTYKIPESVLVVIHTPDLQVLLLERADRPGYWQSVTGSKDAIDEPLIVTAWREVLEETGIDAGSDAESNAGSEAGSIAGPNPGQGILTDWHHAIEYEIYSVWRHRYAPGVTRNTEHWFGLLLPQTRPVRIAPREHLQYAWLDYQEAAARCFSPSNSAAILELPKRSFPAH